MRRPMTRWYLTHRSKLEPTSADNIYIYNFNVKRYKYITYVLNMYKLDLTHGSKLEPISADIIYVYI